MSRLTDLIAQAKKRDPQLGADLDREFKVLSSRLPFGLNFERHRPEAVELPLRPIRKGDKVRALPPRGEIKSGDQRLWQVKAIHKATQMADLELLGVDESERQSVSLNDLVVVAEFRDLIHPGLVSGGTVMRGGDKPFHTVINGENYHVLKALTYTHRGNVDAIYIDPPYNTGAKDWKYNNDYVEKDDLYRHSKWLAMMERRLQVARELLNPEDSVLIVTIDEKEYLRLGLLLEQTFPEGTIQMVSTVINRKGSARAGGFSRVDEYIFFVRFGSAEVIPTNIDVIGLGAGITKERLPDIWNQLMRRGTDSLREDSPNLFYPIFVDPKSKAIVEIGDALPLGAPRSSILPRRGIDTVWPIRTNGAEGRWSVGPEGLRERLENGYVKVGNKSPSNGLWTINYLISKDIKRLNNGEILSNGRDKNGAHILSYADMKNRIRTPKTIWNLGSHDATEHGKTFLTNFLGGRKFPFPKSLYAVEDALRFFIRDKPSAVVLDFFSGSGTTAHAVMRLNKQDGGHRQCISVTNNEVGADEQKALRKRGLRPGDKEWEKWGICDYITKPRVQAAITGKKPNGELIRGDYKFTDEFPMVDGFDENAEFFTLTYETDKSVGHNLAYTRIAPLLWLRAGARGKRIDKLPAEGWAVADAYGLLAEVDKATPFVKALTKAKGARLAFIVTDDERRFQSVAKRLPKGVEPVRLYESYLTNFSFTNGD
ncbi:DNA methyltransferase [Luteimonas sp. M1R5S18]|uniref:site-specific DNA-methyltransferase (adenine-specific) n=1 Tax=Luteimonas rhizosphaericola TaxID=3042024 RepID=A0ABT6JJK7_9GAMM|nr:DNA methyltransferase [Luteimonas rhizosphaericola]MDH5830211.1 DNA methyltransferase [Luteimonas rhizosphaericola]